MAGRGDIDLLVASESRTAFRRIVDQLGFKPVLSRGERQVPGVESYFGLDPAVPRLLHLHVHYRLVLGDYWRTSYRLPLERGLIETAVRGDLFPVPSPTYQFLVFVLRMALAQRGGLLLTTGDRWRRGIQIQLDNLEALCDRDALAALLVAHLPTIDVPFLDRCVASFRGKYRVVERALLWHALHRRLRAYARRPPLAAVLDAVGEKLVPLALRRRISDERMRFSGGGTVIALIGGDGAGKSTCARELESWLSSDFATVRAHLGNPPRSVLTFLIGVALKAERAMNGLLLHASGTATHLELFRHVCTARDCYRLYEKIQRFSAQGGIAICERYPVSEVPSHVGPRIPALLSAGSTSLTRLLQRAEGQYYEWIRRPDLLFVLRLDPELAVARKPEEPRDYVRTRGRAVWEVDWTAARAELIDAGQSLSSVLDDLKDRIWRSL
jgi:thymidylate kinase